MPTEFQNKVYNELKKVPKGKVTTYKSLALASKTKAYRAVGTAMNKNPHSYPKNPSKKTSLLTPCHRVINSDGRIGKFASGTKNKMKLLKKEGVEINKGKIDLKRFEFKL
jgi:methylated-DNA-[protein]-cysteine S-methyltransferase